MDVTAVAEGDSAIDAYRETLDRGYRYDVVVMDLTVKGGMGGKEAMKRLLEVDPSARVIVASGYANDPIMANFREYGFVNVLRKPFNVNDFIRVIVEVMGEG
jgi:CheY-like chemotaxis protein